MRLPVKIMMLGLLTSWTGEVVRWDTFSCILIIQPIKRTSIAQHFSFDCTCSQVADNYNEIISSCVIFSQEWAKNKESRRKRDTNSGETFGNSLPCPHGTSGFCPDSWIRPYPKIFSAPTVVGTVPWMLVRSAFWWDQTVDPSGTLSI